MSPEIQKQLKDRGLSDDVQTLRFIVLNKHLPPLDKDPVSIENVFGHQQ